MHHDNALPTVRRHNIFEFLSNKFKQSKAIYLYFFNSALSVYLRKSFFNHRQYNYYHRADARVSPRHQSLASCCSLGMPSAFDRNSRRAHLGPRTSRHPALGVSRIATRPSNHPFTPRAHGCLILADYKLEKTKPRRGHDRHCSEINRPRAWNHGDPRPRSRWCVVPLLLDPSHVF